MDEPSNFPRNQFGQYCIPAGAEHRPAARAVLSGQVFEPDTIEFMRSHAGDGDIIHAGTFFGDFLPAVSSALRPDARLWAFEPNPTSYLAAQKTVELNKLENVTLANAALSNQDETLSFRTHEADGKALGGGSHVTDETGPGVEHVHAVMLDYVVPLKRKISILQLDVEGHEKPALLGAYHLINRWQPILILEYFKHARWLRHNFLNLGYRRVGKLHSNYVFSTKPLKF